VAFTSQLYGGNAAETPWVLSTSVSSRIPYGLSLATEETASQVSVIGRRTFGNFKKQATAKTATTGDAADNSLSSAESDDANGQTSMRPRRKMGKEDEKVNGKRRQTGDDASMDKINLKKLRNSGISAASGLRQTGFVGKRFTKDQRKART
jgi:hypothetical protein